MRRTTIDIGTNTILMLIAEFDKKAFSINPVLDIQRIPRLGKGVDSSRNILPESIQKAITILNEYKQISLENGSVKITATATSFIRDSHNKNEFINAIKENTSIEIEVLSGEDEARWTFIGGIYDKLRVTNDGLWIITIDIGGGSTEITSAPLFPPGGGKNISLLDLSVKGKSLNVGSVRIKEKILTSHPPLQNEIKQAEEFILSYLNQFDKSDEFDKSDKLIGLAGTITTLGAIKLGLDKFIADKVDNLELSITDIRQLLSILSTKSLYELYSIGNYMGGRADIIIPGTLILKCFMEKFGFDKLTISTKGLRYGIFLRDLLN